MALVSLVVACGRSGASPDASADSADAVAPLDSGTIQAVDAESAPADAARLEDTGQPAATPGFVPVLLTNRSQWDADYPPVCDVAPSLCFNRLFTGGVAVRDLDGDARLDIVLSRMNAAPQLLFNTARGFVEVAAPALEVVTRGNGMVFGDFDNDGDADLFVTTVGDTRTYLFVNDGRGGFDERAISRGVAMSEGDPHSGTSACAGDFDLDGWLDLYTTEWRGPDRSLSRSHNTLFRNRAASAPAYFEDLGDSLGVDVLNVRRAGAWGFTPHLSDLDADGWPDLTVTSDFLSSRLFWNQGGSFIDGTREAAVGTDENGMGSAVGDYDGDGDLDLFVTAVYHEDEPCPSPCSIGRTGNRLYRNDGARRFTDVTDEAGVRDGGWGWGARFFDYDLDGDLDLVAASGYRQADEALGFQYGRVRLWRNDGGRFTEVAEAEGLVDLGIGRAIATFDYDLDGDEDVLVTHSMGRPALWRNDASEGRAWLVVRPVGTMSNRDGVGAVVRVWPREGDAPLVRHSGNACGFLSHTPGWPHFGLNDVETVHRVEITWPASGHVQSFVDVPARQTLVVTEPD